MKKIYFTVGPSQLFPKVPFYVNEAIKKDIFSLSHRGDVFQSLFLETTNNIKKLFNIPATHHIFFLSSSTEAMERIIENCVAKKSYHIINGEFAKRFYEISKEFKKNASEINFTYEKNFDFENMKISKDTELLCITQTDTSVGVSIDMRQIYPFKKRNKDFLVAVDMVSSAPYVDIDYSYIDCAFFSIQKGFGLPAGLGVIIVSPTALEKSQYLQSQNYPIGSFHNFPTLLKYAQKGQTPETPNVFLLYLLHKVTNDMLKISINTIRKETDEKAKLLYDFFEDNEKFSPFIKNKQYRAKTVVVAEVKNGTKKLIDALSKKGIIVGSGYGEFKDKHIRIANFPTHSMQSVKRLIHYLQ